MTPGTFIDTYGEGAFAKTIGKPASHVRTMKARNSIPLEYWPKIVAAASRRQIRGVTYRALTLMHIKRGVAA